LSINTPVNFLQLGKYCQYGKQHYYQHFEVDFDILNFNATLVSRYCGIKRSIAFDPSFIPKSGSKIQGVGWFL
jgi:hypothetical protein